MKINESRGNSHSLDAQIDAFIIDCENKAIQNDKLKKEINSFLKTVSRLLKEASDDEGKDKKDKDLEDFLTSGKEKEEQGSQETGQETKKDKAEETDQPGDTKSLGDESFSVDNEKKEEFEQKSKNIDVEIFCSNLVRLINGYDKLLNIKSTIVNRANEFLRENYSDTIARKTMITLRKNYKVDTSKNLGEEE